MTVFLVGAGPGDPGLLTVRGRDLLSEADVVLYDALVDPRLLGLTAPGSAWELGGPLYTNRIPPASLYGYNLDDPSPGYYGGGRYREYYSYGRGAGLALFRAGYAWRRQTEGLGLGDVKLGAAIGTWLPLEAIPWCFGLATSAALLAVMLARLSGAPVMRTTKIPFGAFLCPALWIAFYADCLTR